MRSASVSYTHLYLNEVVIYNKDNSYTEYAGQAVIFTLSLADGSQVEIIDVYKRQGLYDIGQERGYGATQNMWMKGISQSIFEASV